jgi:hypothetical protein
LEISVDRITSLRNPSIYIEEPIIPNALDHIQDNRKIVLPANSVTSFYITVLSKQKKQIKGFLNFASDAQRSFPVIVKYKVYNGTVNLMPSQIRFNPSFPGIH